MGKSLQQLLVTNFALNPSGYTGSRGDIGYAGSAGAGATVPTITAISYPGDDTAADTAGGQTITLTGTGFASGALVVINGAQVGVVSVVNSTTITFTAPANSTGSYILYVVNTNGTTALAVPGIQYSGTPTWTTAAGSLGTSATQSAFTANLTATGDAPITYSVTSGSLPDGLSLSANTGVISGTTPNVSIDTTYSFTVQAADAQRQTTDRNFSLSINTLGSYLATDLFMHYDFSNASCYNGSGSVVTDLQGTRNGTITGATFGGSGSAKFFDFEADGATYIQFGSDIPSGQSTSALSIEAWIYTESLGGTNNPEGIGAVVSSQSDSGGNKGASLNTDTRTVHGGGPDAWHPQIGNGSSWATGNYNTPSGTAAVSNRWDHVVMTWSDGAPVDVYKNGTRVSTNNTGWSASIAWSGTYWSLGRQLSNAGYPRAYDGKIAIARIYNRGLSSAEITSNYNGQKSRFGL